MVLGLTSWLTPPSSAAPSIAMAKMANAFIAFMTMAAVAEVGICADYSIGAPDGSWDLQTKFSNWVSSKEFLPGDNLSILRFRACPFLSLFVFCIFVIVKFIEANNARFSSSQSCALLAKCSCLIFSKEKLPLIIFNSFDSRTNIYSSHFENRIRTGNVNRVFVYGPTHSVLEVTKGDYDTCTTTNPLSSDSSGNTSIALTAPGTRYFICGTPMHCPSGMKIEILVSSPSSSPPVATPPPPQKSEASTYDLRVQIAVAFRLGLAVLMLVAL